MTDSDLSDYETTVSQLPVPSSFPLELLQDPFLGAIQNIKNKHDTHFLQTSEKLLYPLNCLFSSLNIPDPFSPHLEDVVCLLAFTVTPPKPAAFCL